MRTAATIPRRSKAATAAAVPRRKGPSLEFWLVFIMLLMTAIFPVIGKYRYSDQQSQSTPSAQLLWSTMYLVAGIRLIQMRIPSAALLSKSWSIWVLLIYFLLSTAWSVIPIGTLINAIELIGTTVIAYYVVVRFTLLEFMEILALSFAVIAVLSFLVIFGSPVHGRMDWGGGAWTGLYQEKNNLAAAMAVAVVTLVVLVLTGRGRARWLGAGALLLCAGLLVGSRSATATMSVFVALAVVVVGLTLRSPKVGPATRFAILGGGAFLVLIVVGIGLSPDTVLQLTGRDANLTGRTDFWPYLISAIKDRPLQGYGYDAFFRSTDGYQYLSYYVQEAGGWYPYHSHNSFIQCTIDGGLIGLGAFVWMLLVGLWRALGFVMRGANGTAVWPLAILVYLTVGSATETYFNQFNTVETLVTVAAILYPLRDRLPGIERR